MDETGWRVGGDSCWLWAATTPEVIVSNVAEGRGFDEACHVVADDDAGVVVRDGWAPYRSYTQATHQTCLAQLLRRCHHLATDLPAWARSTPRSDAALLTEALDAHDLPQHERVAKVADLAERVELPGENAHRHDECRKLVNHFTNEADALFTFLTRPDVDATNWRGEQAIRPAVVNRKVWGGTTAPGAVRSARAGS